MRAQLALRFLPGQEYRFSLDKIARARSEPPPRSKSDAEALADRVRSEIRSGTFRDPNHAPEPAAAPDGRLTLNDVLDRYLKEYVNVPTRRETAQKGMRGHVGMIRRVEIPAAQGCMIALGLKFLDDITPSDVEQVRQTRRREMARLVLVLAERKRQRQQPAAAIPINGAPLPDAATAAEKPAKRTRPVERFPGVKGGEVGINRLLARLRHTFNWAIEQGISGIAIERKERREDEQQQARARAREQQQAQQAAEKDCHTMAECDSAPGSVTFASDVVKH